MKDAREMKIDEPCTKRWAELEGAGTRRYCGSCELHVVNGSALTKAAAESMVEESAGRVCMRLELNKEGSAVYAPEPSKESMTVRTGVALTLAAGMLVACTDQPPEPSTPKEPVPAEATAPSTDRPLERPLEIMGEICYPAELPEQKEAPPTSKPEDNVELTPRKEVLGRVHGRSLK